jgi:virginiamycin B lyase
MSIADAMRAPRQALPIAAALVAVLVIAAGAYVWFDAWPRGEFVEYAMADPHDTPTAIAAARDGSVWFTIDHADAIGRVRGGRIERLTLPGRAVEPIGLAVAEDGSVWYTDMARNGISRMAPSGEVTSFRLETPIVRLGRLAIAPDGAAWFAEPTGYSITRLKDGNVARHVPESPRDRRRGRA